MQQGTEVYVPPVPPAKKKSRAWIWIAVAAVLLVGYAMNQVEEKASPGPIEIDAPLSEHDLNLSAAEWAWDTALTADQRIAICDFYNVPPVGLTPELVTAYQQETDLTYAQANAVLDELLSREC